jgi:hypothetical protein
MDNPVSAAGTAAKDFADFAMRELAERIEPIGNGAKIIPACVDDLLGRPPRFARNGCPVVRGDHAGEAYNAEAQNCLAGGAGAVPLCGTRPHRSR